MDERGGLRPWTLVQPRRREKIRCTMPGGDQIPFGTKLGCCLTLRLRLGLWYVEVPGHYLIIHDIVCEVQLAIENMCQALHTSGCLCQNNLNTFFIVTGICITLCRTRMGTGSNKHAGSDQKSLQEWGSESESGGKQLKRSSHPPRTSYLPHFSSFMPQFHLTCVKNLSTCLNFSLHTL